MRFSVLTVCLALLLSGCSSDSPSGVEVVAAEVAGQKVQAFTPKKAATSPVLVIVMHGVGGAELLLSKSPRKDSYAEYARHGAVVVTSAAHGDAWGSAASERDYVALAAWATGRWHPRWTVLIGESMGGLVALRAMADRAIPNVSAWVGISPVTDLGVMAASATYRPMIDAAHTDWQPVAPRRLPKGVPYRLFVSPTDHVVEPAENGAAYARSGAAAGLDMQAVDCPGGHVSAECYADAMPTVLS